MGMSEFKQRSFRIGSEQTWRQHLADLRHELRTPLNAIIGYSEMLLEQAREDGQENLIPDLVKIRAAGRDLSDLIGQALDPAKAEQPGAPEYPSGEPEYVSGAPEYPSGESEYPSGEPEYPSGEPEYVSGFDLGTIAAQLDFDVRTPLNAIMGYTAMLLEDVQAEGREDFVPILQRIRDAASGFLTRIGEIADPARGALGRALQLGRLTVDRHEQSEEGSAPALPVEGDTTSVPAGVAARSPPEGYSSARPRAWGNLLVVDDNESNRDILTHYLWQRGYAVAVAGDGRQALEMLGAHSFDLVLLDVLMPEMDGYQVLQRLKSDDRWRDIPVIMISALDEIDSVVRCIEMGAEDYLPKPFDPVLLNARISASLEKKRLRDHEVEYLRNVACITAAAAALEAGRFEPETLADVAQRSDGLGQLARVFQSMAREVYAREQRLRRQVRELRIELSEASKARQVAEITETEYFRRLQADAQDLRDILDGTRD